MKAGSRLGKIAKKSVGTLPDSWLITVLAISTLLAAALLWPRRRRRRADRRRTPVHERSEPSLGLYNTSTPRQLNR
jgi:hypothetical protein